MQPPILSVADRVCCREVNNRERHDSTTISSNSLVKEDVPFPASLLIRCLYSSVVYFEALTSIRSITCHPRRIYITVDISET